MQKKKSPDFRCPEVGISAVMSKSVLCVDNEKDGKCGAMERPYTTFICDKPPEYCLYQQCRKVSGAAPIKRKMVNV